MSKQLPLVLEVAGGVCVVAGVAVLSVAAALVVAGVLLLVFGAAADYLDGR